MTNGRVTRFLFLATFFCVTFEKVHWSIAGTVNLADILAVLFLGAFAFERIGRADGSAPRTTGIVLAFLAAFLLVYLGGFFNLDTSDAAAQFGKGMIKFLIHFLFLAGAVTYLAERAEGFYWRTLGWFCAGMAANAGYGVLQLLAAQAGSNLDNLTVKPLTGGASSINIYGGVNGSSVYRPNALTGDPNHLGIMLVIPLLVLLPIYMRLEPGHRWKRWLAVLLAFLLVVELATLSRSGLLGLFCGLLVLALPYRRLLVSRAVLVPLGVVAVLLAAVVAQRSHFFSVVLKSRVQTGGSSTSAHFGVYDFIPKVLHSHPLLGLGLNNFSVYYEFITGKTNWGPHSFYVALLVETGLVGTAVFAVFLLYLFRRIGATRRLGRALAAVRDPRAARVRPLGWGLTAALVATMVSNAFYLTMQFYYFYAFAALCLAAPIVFSKRVAAEHR